jgi:hypothetical protein
MCSLFCRGKIIFDIRKTVIVNYVYVFLWKWMYCLKTLREEHRLRVFENRVLRRIFGPKRDEVTCDW